MKYEIRETKDEGRRTETQTWLEFSLACSYIDKSTFENFDEKYEHIYAMLVTMEREADEFCRIRPTSYVPYVPGNELSNMNRGG